MPLQLSPMASKARIPSATQRRRPVLAHRSSDYLSISPSSRESGSSDSTPSSPSSSPELSSHCYTQSDTEVEEELHHKRTRPERVGLNRLTLTPRECSAGALIYRGPHRRLLGTRSEVPSPILPLMPGGRRAWKGDSNAARYWPSSPRSTHRRGGATVHRERRTHRKQALKNLLAGGQAVAISEPISLDPPITFQRRVPIEPSASAGEPRYPSLPPPMPPLFPKYHRAPAVDSGLSASTGESSEETQFVNVTEFDDGGGDGDFEGEEEGENIYENLLERTVMAVRERAGLGGFGRFAAARQGPFTSTKRSIEVEGREEARRIDFLVDDEPELYGRLISLVFTTARRSRQLAQLHSAQKQIESLFNFTYHPIQTTAATTTATVISSLRFDLAAMDDAAFPHHIALFSNTLAFYLRVSQSNSLKRYNFQLRKVQKIIASLKEASTTAVGQGATSAIGTTAGGSKTARVAVPHPHRKSAASTLVNKFLGRTKRYFLNSLFGSHGERGVKRGA